MLGLGKLGGVELNYSSDIDLIFLYEQDGQTDARRTVSNQEYFERLSKEVIRLLTEPTDLGVGVSRRPAAAAGRSRGPLCTELRQHAVVLRREGPHMGAAGVRQGPADRRRRELGHELLARLEPWIYRNYLSLADITGIKSLKRRIEQRAEREGGDLRNVKTGHGGIRDIEFVIQFLQLLNGGALPEVRTGNTLEAIARLEKAGCLTPDERAKLEDNYNMLRKLEHRLQIMFDLQDAPAARRSRRAGQAGRADGLHRHAAHFAAARRFKTTTRGAREQNREMLDHCCTTPFPATRPRSRKSIW